MKLKSFLKTKLKKLSAIPYLDRVFKIIKIYQISMTLFLIKNRLKNKIKLKFNMKIMILKIFWIIKYQIKFKIKQK